MNTLGSLDELSSCCDDSQVAKLHQCNIHLPRRMETAGQSWGHRPVQITDPGGKMFQVQIGETVLWVDVIL